MGISIGGTPLASVGWRLLRTSGLDDPPKQDLQTAKLPLADITEVTSSYRPADPKTGVLTVATWATSFSALDTLIDALYALIASGGPLTLTHTRHANRELVVYVTGGTSGYGGGPEAIAPGYIEFGLQVVAPSPFWRSTSDTTVNFTTTPVACAQGTADTRGVITVTSAGTVVNPIVLYKTGAGVTISTLSPTITIASGDAWQFNAITGQVLKRVSAVWSNAASTLPDHFVVPVFRQSHFTAGVNSPTMQVSAGSGSVVYRKQYR